MMEKGENPLVLKDSSDMSRLLALVFLNPPSLPYPLKKVMVQTGLANRKIYEKEFKEMEPDIPYWVQLQPDWQNAFIGCMRCQFVCPVNKPYLDNIVAGPSLSEEETGLILNNTLWGISLNRLGKS
jgi:formate hydrogenlyase subunit 6/NADH:ubiquinone oxidoreductase subunit I